MTETTTVTAKLTPTEMKALERITKRMPPREQTKSYAIRQAVMFMYLQIKANDREAKLNGRRVQTGGEA